MKKFFLILLSLTLCLPLWGQPNKYVAIGDSLTAGYTSGGLVETYQTNSYPALIAKQLGISDFELPLISEPGIPALLKLYSLVPPVIAPVTLNPAEWGTPLNLTLSRPYDNLGVPGATLYDALNTVSDNGGMHDLILRGLGTQVEQAIALNPDLITVWIGNNDALGAVVTGTAIPGVTLTPPDSFEAMYTQLIQALTSNTQAKIVVATIPDVAAIPFVTTVPPYIINPATGEPFTWPDGTPMTYLGQNDDEQNPFVSPDSFILLTALPYITQGYGIPEELGGRGEPLPPEVVLTPGETSTIREHLSAFNEAIVTIADQEGLSVVDVHGIFNEIVTSGYSIAGIELTQEFLTGGIFSYDGIHPGALGYAIIANFFIDAMNKLYGNPIISPVSLAPFIDGTAWMGEGGSLRQLSIEGLEATVQILSKPTKLWSHKALPLSP